MQPAVVWYGSGVRRPSSEARLVPYPVLGSLRRALLCVLSRQGRRQPAHRGAASPASRLRWKASRGWRERRSQATFTTTNGS